MYNVKLRGYLLYAVNMCFAFDNQEQETTDQTKVENTALLIWPNMFSGYEYGLQTVINDEHYNIMLKEDLTAEDAQFDDIVNQKKDMLENLYGRAMEMWGIE